MLRAIQFGTTYISTKPVGSSEYYQQLHKWAEMKERAGIPAKMMPLGFTKAHEYVVVTDEEKDNALTANRKMMEQLGRLILTSRRRKMPVADWRKAFMKALSDTVHHSYDKATPIRADFEG